MVWTTRVPRVGWATRVPRGGGSRSVQHRPTNFRRNLKKQEKWLRLLGLQIKSYLDGYYVIGIGIVEAGEQGKPWPKAFKKEFEAMVIEVFKDAGASEHGPPQFFCADNEHLLGVFRAEIEVFGGEVIYGLSRHQP